MDNEQNTPATLPANHITITANFDTSVTSSPDAASYESAVNTAIQFLESQFVSPAGRSVDLSISFGYGENAGTPLDPKSGATSQSSATGYSYSDLYNAFQATDTTSAVQIAAAASLSSTDPTGGSGTFFVTPSEALALGLATGTPGTPTVAGSVGLSVDTYNWSETGPQNPNGSDAVSEFEHEITEVMGRTDSGGVSNNYTPLDLFRYTAANGKTGDGIGAAAGARDEPFVRGYNANAYSYFSYDGKTVTLEYDTPTEVSAAGGGQDIADWTTSTTPVYMDSFDGAGPPGEIDPVSTTDLQEMNALGFDEVPVCFLRGTCIETTEGAVPVENLRVGDVVKTHAGELRPVRWLGSRQFDCSRHPNPAAVWPIRVSSGAFADNVPVRDLWVSPGHSLLIDGVLIQAGRLVNGATVVQVPRDRLEYWHVELDSHDVLLSEGLPSESYLDTGNRTSFVGGGAFLDAHPDFAPKHWAQTCVPLAEDGSELVRAKATLLARAAALGFVTTDDADAHVMADGERIGAIRLSASRLAFMLPADRAVIELRSDTFVAAQIDAASGDPRSLGLCVSRIQIDGAELPLNADKGFEQGWHALECYADHSQRWTKGRTTLPAGTRLVLIDTASRGYYWVKPVTAVAALFG